MVKSKILGQRVCVYEIGGGEGGDALFIVRRNSLGVSCRDF